MPEWRRIRPASIASTDGLAAVVWSDSEAQFVTVGSTNAGVGRCYTSPDGFTWTQQTLPSTPNGQRGLARSESQDMWVSCGGSTGAAGQIYYSSDGVTWTKSTQAIFGTSVIPNGVAYSANENQWVVVGSTDSSTSPTIATATDPTGTWTSQTPSVTRRLVGVARDETGDMWCAAAEDTGPIGRGMRSTDGATWSDGTTTTAVTFEFMRFMAGPGLFVSSDSTNVYTSPDGSTFTSRTNIGGYAFGGVWSPDYQGGLGLLCGGNVTQILYSSTNGTSWTAEDIAGIGMQSGEYPRDAAYSPSLERWVVVCSGGVVLNDVTPIVDQAQTLIVTSTGRHW